LDTISLCRPVYRKKKGRTILEFIIGVQVGSTAASIIWISIFGNPAFHVELFGPERISEVVQENINTALYSLPELFLLAYILCPLRIVVS